MLKLLFITIADNTVGYGHLNRCLSLAEHAAHRKIEASFLLFGDQSISSSIEEAGYHVSYSPLSMLNIQHIQESLAKFGILSAIVLDLSHPVILHDQEQLRQIIGYLHHSVPNIMLIDSLEEHALIKRLPDIPVDFVVVPYVGATKQEGTWRYLSGPSYAVLSAAYTNSTTRMIRPEANRVLISCGGSDPKKVTLTILEGIEKIPKILDLRVIIGPLFDESLKKAIKGLITNSKHSITLLDSPKGLAPHMLWCDLAIAASGLIKYELAATSTPAILVSIDEFHHLMNQPFSQIGSVVDLGAKVNSLIITEQVNNLLDNQTRRLALATAGREAVDGKGAERLISEITRSCCVA